MSDNKRSGSSGKGVYIVLALCAFAIGISGYLYYTNIPRSVDTALQETLSQEIFLEIPEEPEDIPVLATQPRATAPTPTESGVPSVTKQPLKTGSPLSGSPVFGYSMEALSYNQTTRDWRVHNGVDLAAEEGAQVCAAADGEVFSVYEDDSYGYTVVLRHSDGYTTRYASLTSSIPVVPGQKVTLGQLIGYAGDTAIVETAMGSHVHFSVTHYDEAMDPQDFLTLG